MLESNPSTTQRWQQYPTHWLEPTIESRCVQPESAPIPDEVSTRLGSDHQYMGEHPRGLPHADPDDNCQSVPHHVDIIGGDL